MLVEGQPIPPPQMHHQGPPPSHMQHQGPPAHHMQQGPPPQMHHPSYGPPQGGRGGGGGYGYRGGGRYGGRRGGYRGRRGRRGRGRGRYNKFLSISWLIDWFGWGSAERDRRRRESVERAIQAMQVLLSDDNLVNDVGLRKSMDEEGFSFLNLLLLWKICVLKTVD